MKSRDQSRDKISGNIFGPLDVCINLSSFIKAFDRPSILFSFKDITQ